VTATGPVEAGDLAAVEEELLEEHPAGGLHHVSFQLVPDAVGVDDLPAVVRDVEPLHPDGTGLAVHLDVSDHSHVGADQRR
jgi:hypothetical protein